MKGPIIGNEMSSETKDIGFYSTEGTNLVYVDTPGLSDNRSEG